MHELRPITVADMQAQAAALLHAHWDEVEDGSRGAMRPRWDRYTDYEAAGILRIQGAFDGDELVGYCVLMLGAHLHDSEARPARIDAMFVRQDARGRRLGLRLVKWALETSAELAATESCAHARRDSAAAKLLEAMGFVEREVVYVRGI